MKQFGLTETKLLHFYRRFKNGGGGGGGGGGGKGGPPKPLHWLGYCNTDEVTIHIKISMFAPYPVSNYCRASQEWQWLHVLFTKL